MKNGAMKKNIVIIAAAAVVVCAVIFGVFKFVNADDAPGGGSASNTGEGLRDGAHMLLNEGWAIDLPGSERPVGDQNAVMSINGVDVSNGFYQYKLGLMTSVGSDDPEAATLDLLKKYVVQWQFADENGILPDEKEIADAVRANRDPIDEDEAAHDAMVSFLNGAELTEHEYWDIIQTEYEAPYALLNEMIAAYCSENDVSAPQWDDAEVVFNK